MDWSRSGAAILAREGTTGILGPLVSHLEQGPTVSGREHVDGTEAPFVVCANHASHLDVSTLRLALGRRHRLRLAPAAAEDYFYARRPVRRFLAGWLGAFPFRRQGAGSDSMRRMEDLLATGWNVVLFPEGTRSRSGEMLPFKAGIGLVAVRTGRPVVPARIRGTHVVLPPGAWLPRRHPVTVTFGLPLVAEPVEDVRAFTARLEAAIRAL
jgi:1-acyl-sn-glycerol-3-phosphate acyltransferase